MPPDPSTVDDDYCYLTTTGRVSGEPHEIEIWFALANGWLYMLAGSGAKANWVRNIQAEPRVTVRIRDVTYPGRGRVLAPGDEDALARDLLVTKYQPRHGDDLTGWGQRSLPVAIDFEG